ncbi:hypothetical protein JXA34_03650 [Patescibacteria group bacterium]|nr:hypothetical protein [Patescibacteria group bacterium]
MHKKDTDLVYTLGFCIAVLLISKKAYAYIDLGTGSYMIQIVLAGVLGALFVFKTSILKIIGKMKAALQKSKKNETKEKDNSIK